MLMKFIKSILRSSKLVNININIKLIANLVEFGQKEQFMIVCNPWIISHKQTMIQCVNQFCTSPESEKGI